MNPNKSIYFYFSLFFFFLVLFCIPTVSYAQENSESVITYDLVYLKNGKILKGEILVFEEKDGDITFKDSSGRKYSITREEYDYFVEDKRYFVNKKDTLSIKPRKTTEFEISLGFNGTAATIKESVKEDDAFLEKNLSSGFTYIPICFQFGVGKFINRQNFVGVSGDFGVLGGPKNYLNFGLRYMYQYDAYKRNVSFYVPVELQFSSIRFDNQYTQKDSVTFDGGLTYYPTSNDVLTDVSINSISFSAGQGFSFMLNNKKSISLELKLFKSFILSHKFIDLEADKPKSDFKLNGFKLALFYNI
ncbi:MAG: hypothetical protein V4604_15515 [Bacteroidota bacterium]